MQRTEKETTRNRLPDTPQTLEGKMTKAETTRNRLPDPIPLMLEDLGGCLRIYREA